MAQFWLKLVRIVNYIAVFGSRLLKTGSMGNHLHELQRCIEGGLCQQINELQQLAPCRFASSDMLPVASYRLLLATSAFGTKQPVWVCMSAVREKWM